MKALILTLLSGVFLLACSPRADFNSDDSRFKSLMDGETVEVVEDDTLVEALGDDSSLIGNDQNDAIANNQNDDNDDGEGSANDDGEGSTSDDGEVAHDDDKKGKGKGKGPKHDKPKERLLEQDEMGDHDNMMTSPVEIDLDDETLEAISCGNGKAKKVSVCHFPNADYDKRKTLCIGLPALQAHLAHLGAKRGTEHVDYAGPCQGLEEVDEDDEDNVGDDDADE